MKELGTESFTFRGVRDVIHILHCFEKKSREIPRKDVQLAQQRFKAVRARMEEERKHAKPSH
jgi:phage-related protein